jgi:two-component sensor histidine kinase
VPAAREESPPEAGPRVRLDVIVEPTAESVYEARQSLRDALDGEFSPRVANAALDVAHELLINAHHHGAPPISLGVELGARGVLIEVTDASNVPAKLLPYRPGVSERGLGLQLVRQLTTEWGQHVGDEGKTVWARID